MRELEKNLESSEFVAFLAFPQIKCYHKNTLSSGRDIIFRCQFHTGAIVDHGLVLDKTELDDACKGGLFSVACLNPLNPKIKN